MGNYRFPVNCTVLCNGTVSSFAPSHPNCCSRNPVFEGAKNVGTSDQSKLFVTHSSRLCLWIWKVVPELSKKHRISSQKRNQNLYNLPQRKRLAYPKVKGDFVSWLRFPDVRAETLTHMMKHKVSHVPLQMPLLFCVLCRSSEIIRKKGKRFWDLSDPGDIILPPAIIWPDCKRPKHSIVGHPYIYS